jgi:hypothetical protein
MASQGPDFAQGPHADLRRTVDRVGERFDERSPACADGLIGVPEPAAGRLTFVPFVGKYDHSGVN